MHPYLGSNIRIKNVYLYVAASTYSLDHIAEMESITSLWEDGNISVWDIEGHGKRIGAEDFLPILNSPTILQCRNLEMVNADFYLRNYKILYSVKIIQISYISQDIALNHWLNFLEQPGVKPVIVFHSLYCKHFDTILDGFSKDFSSATSPNAFKIVFTRYKARTPFTEFCETNKTSGETLELKKGMAIEYQRCPLKDFVHYTLKRSRI